MSNSRDLRQKECVKKWISAKCRGTLIQPPSCGKTVTALKCLKVLLGKYPDFKVLIVVPTEPIKKQWITQIDDWGFTFNCDVQIINSAIKKEQHFDVLVLDEISKYAANTFLQIFKKVKYKAILGLTATFKRLDGKHELIKKYCPIIDEITELEARINNWINSYKEYMVLIDIDNIEEYKAMNKEFTECMEFFDYNFNTILSCTGPKGYITCTEIRDLMMPSKIVNGKVINEQARKDLFKQIKFKSIRGLQLCQKRKKFINNHPKKLEIARKIIEARPFSKILTFSNNVSMAESIGGGEVYTGKTSKKRSSDIIDRFRSGALNLVHSCVRLNEGLNIPDLSVAIILGLDSSDSKAIQKKGRVTRLYDNKEAEIFNIIINNTQEIKWFCESHPDNNYIIIDEQGLDDVLNGKEPKPYKLPIQKFTFRF